MKINFPIELTELRDKFLQYKTTQGRGILRIRQIKCSINYLYEYMASNKIKNLSDIKNEHITEFQKFLYKTKFYSMHSVLKALDNANFFCSYLYHNNLIWNNPFNGITYLTPPDLYAAQIKRHYSFEELIRKWTNYMKRKKPHIECVKSKLDCVRSFIKYLESKNIKSIYKVNQETIEEYKKHLQTLQYEPGLYYSPFSQTDTLRKVCQFLSFLYRERIIKEDPAKKIIFRRYYRELKEKLINTSPLRRRGIDIPDLEIKTLLEKFIQHQISAGFSPEGSRNYVLAVEKLYTFMVTRGINDLRKLTKRDFLDFQSWIYGLTDKNGKKYASSTMAGRIFCVKSFFRYLVKCDYLESDYSSILETKEEKGLPHTCMTEREVNILLNQPDITNPIGLRDKALMEVLYSTGIRAKELAGLRIEDIDFSGGLLRVEDPKGGKSFQRIIPIGKTALEYVGQYIKKVRHIFNTNDNQYLFLTPHGRKMRRNYLNFIVHRHLFNCGLRKKITTHSFRVSCATHMLQNSADIRYVQEQLGHRSIKTTQGYTRLVPKDLKLIHTKCHPREKNRAV